MFFSVCACSLQSEPTGVFACHETAALSTAKSKLCNAEVYHCISCACNTPRRSEQNECYGPGNCFWLRVVSVCSSLLSSVSKSYLSNQCFSVFFSLMFYVCFRRCL